MKRRMLLTLALAASLLYARAALAQIAVLTITITNLRGDRGAVLVNLDTADTWFSGRAGPVRSLRLTPRNRTASAHFEGLPPGEYALRIYHDENNDGRLNTGLFGIPTERFGFSGARSARLGPPPFETAKFILAGDAALVIRLR